MNQKKINAKHFNQNAISTRMEKPNGTTWVFLPGFRMAGVILEKTGEFSVQITSNGCK